MSPCILLLQARRETDPAKEEERASFANKAGLPPASFVSHDLLLGPPPLSQVRDYDALMVGGSGDFYVSQKDLPYFSETSAFFRQVVEMGHPVFASCFGFHVMTHALGGEIIYDPDNMEVGTYEIALTGFARGDELFRDLPLAFQAQLGHKDRASKLPPSVVNLGYSQRCPYQAFRVPGAPIWATQFHPELTGEENLLRYHRYLDGYASVMSPEERDQALSRFSESPETHNLIPRFLALIA